MKKHIIFLGLISIAILAQAQGKWTLRQCVDYAVENNIELRQQALNVKNAEINLSTSKNSRLPDLSASVGQNFSFGQNYDYQTNTSYSQNSSNTNFSIGTSVPLFTGFRIPNQIKVNELNLMATTEGLKKAKENLELQVVSLFLEVLFQKEILKVHTEQVQLSKEQVERTRLLVEAGKVAQSQYYDMVAQLASNELKVTNAKNTLDLSLLNLSQALNLSSNDDFDVVAPNLDNFMIDNLSSILPPQQVFQMSLGIKPHVKEAEYKLESSKRSLKVAQAGHWPTLNFNASYSNSFNHAYNTDNISVKDQLKNNARKGIGFSLSIPIFSRFEVRNRVRAARLDIENQQLALDNVKLVLYKEIQQAYQSAVSAQSKYSSTEKALSAAEESFKYAKEKYSVGKSTVFEYNEAQTQLISSKSEQIQAKYDFIFKAKILDFYQGKEIDIE